MVSKIVAPYTVILMSRGHFSLIQMLKEIIVMDFIDFLKYKIDNISFNGILETVDVISTCCCNRSFSYATLL